MLRYLSVSKNSTRFWTGMPLARKSKIFGLRSIPANTTPVSLKNRYILRFFAYKVFFRRACQRKNRKCSITDERVDFEVHRQSEPSGRNFCRKAFLTCLWLKIRTFQYRLFLPDCSIRLLYSSSACFQFRPR